MREQLHNSLAKTPFIFFSLFTVSGFAGLIYESIWTHYLKLFLGHAAYAQTLVLAIFMGGMALGSWLCARYGGRWRNLILAYAVIEGVIGLLAFVFHDVFAAGLDFAYEVLIPAIASPVSITVFKWLVSALLILPQSILLGMTFPLMSAGVIRRFPDVSGRIIATLYFSNSIGAAVGVLVSGFLLLDWFGLPGTLRTAGLLNVLVAVLAWYLQRQVPEPGLAPAGPQPAPASAELLYLRLLLVVAVGTGVASFIYEIAWIRMLSLVMGSATHSFELMLSAFILGLALGGLWIRRRIQYLGNILQFLARVQGIMGVLALLTLLIYNQTFDVMHWLLQVVAKNDTGYLQFNLVSHALALLIMLPATVCAGMTLPLITYALLARGVGEKAIGNVYAANTVGAIIGIFFAVHIGMPVLGLKGLLIFGAAIDVAIAVLLLWYLQRSQSLAFPVRGAVIIAVSFTVISLVADLDAYKMASGVYREGKLMQADEFEHAYHADGKTATVDVMRDNTNVFSIRTNGKSDASIYAGPEAIFSADEPTMVLAALAPMAYVDDVRNAAVIGFGSGLSTHALLAAGSIGSVDTVEIEQAMVTGARHFMFRVARAYDDPRSHVYIDDAKTFFSTYQKQYDIILSEPSNPWVSGVAGLFTTDFYRHVSRHLTPDGVFVQWLQLYETDLSLLASVVRALDTVFSDYVVLTPNDADMLLLARQTGKFAAPGAGMFADPGVRAELAAVGIHNLRDFQLRIIGNRDTLSGLFYSYAVPANGDYYPYLDLHAVKARFMRIGAGAVSELKYFPVPVLHMLSRRTEVMNDPVAQFPFLRATELAAKADALAQVLIGGAGGDLPVEISAYAALVPPVLSACQVPAEFSYWLDLIFNNIALGVLAQGGSPALTELLKQTLAAPCAEFEQPHLLWLGLLQGVATLDHAAIVHNSRIILRQKSYVTSKQSTYALIAAMTALVADGDMDGALALWREWGVNEPFVFQGQEAVIRLLLGARYAETAG